ncbi:MAG: hypothetical protein QXX55_00665 [Candidatus Pacearchaeota archaeon]
MVGNYDRIIEKISKASNLSKEDIELKIESKRKKLSGLISKEGAAQVVAAELGISFENEKLKIGELLPGMRKVNTIGKVIRLFPVRTFKTKKGEESKVANLQIADDSSNIKVVLWDTNHVALIEKGQIVEGKVVEILNATMRDNELHLGNFSDIKIINDELGEVVTKKIIKEKKISEFKKGDNICTRAFIVQLFEPRFFFVCPECKKRVEREGDVFVCKLHDKIIPEKKAVATAVLDDGTETIRAVLFHEVLNELGINDFDNMDKLIEQKQALLGKEMFFFGSVRQNAFFNNLETVVDEVEEIEIDKIIEKLEKEI